MADENEEGVVKITVQETVGAFGRGKWPWSRDACGNWLCMMSSQSNCVFNWVSDDVSRKLKFVIKDTALAKCRFTGCMKLQTLAVLCEKNAENGVSKNGELGDECIMRSSYPQTYQRNSGSGGASALATRVMWKDLWLSE